MADLITTSGSGATFNVYYEAENRQKRIEWVSGTATVNDLYSALQDKFDDLAQMDDGTPISAQTPTEYTIGIIDTGDDDPWFIDDTTVEHLTGGAIQTASWTRVQDSNTGIVKFDYTVGAGTDFVDSDVGKTITSTSSTGTLLHFFTDGSNGTAWVRPTNDTSTHNWSGTPTDIAITGGTGTGLTQDAASSTGETLWANIFTIGTIASNTHIYVEQNNSLLVAADDKTTANTTDWWSDGQIDILVKVKDVDVEIDEGVVTVFARQLTKTYSHFETDLTNGGRTAIPLGTGTDLNAGEGVRQMVLTDAGGTFVVGEVITDSSDSTIQGVVTSVSGTNPNVTLQYYLIGDPLTDFSGATGAFTSEGTGTGTAVAPSDVNSGALAGVTFTYSADSTIDVDENDTNENYSVVIDASDELLLDVYQYAQYLTRRGNSGTGDTDGQQGQFYRGIDTYLKYSGTVSGGTIDEGNTVTQATSGATGTVVAHDTTNKVITLRDSRGTFNTSNAVTDDTSSGSITPDTAADAVSPNAAAPFGTFAGGIWFFARGVTVNPTTVPAADAQNFRALTNEGSTITPPNKVTVEVTNLRAQDRVTIHRLTAVGGVVEKNTYNATVHAVGDATLITGTTIDSDEPGKTSGGTVVLVDVTANVELPIRYSSWSGSTFTLANTVGTADAGTSDTALVDAAVDFTTAAKVGDIVVHATKGYTFITEVTDANNCVMAGGTMSGLTTADTYEINAVPVITTTSDEVYVPLLYRYETTGTDGTKGSESTTLTYNADIPALVRVRNANNTASATTPMIPYAAEVTVGSTGLSNAAIRTKDNIHS